MNAARLLISVLALLLAACSTTVNTTQALDPSAVGTMKFSQVRVTSSLPTVSSPTIEDLQVAVESRLNMLPRRYAGHRQSRHHRLQYCERRGARLYRRVRGQKSHQRRGQSHRGDGKNTGTISDQPNLQPWRLWRLLRPEAGNDRSRGERDC